MSWKANAYAAELTVAPNGEKITGTEKLVLLLLSVRHNSDKGYAWPNLKTIAEECCISLRTVTRTINELERKGVLHVEAARSGDGATVGENRYYFIALDGRPGTTRRRAGGRPPGPQDPKTRKRLDVNLTTSENVVDDNYLVVTGNDAKLSPATELVVTDDTPNLIEPEIRTGIPEPAVARAHAREAPTKKNRVALVIDAARARGVDLELSKRDTGEITGSTVAPEKIVDAYLAALDRQWGDDWLWKRLSVSLVIQQIGGYEGYLRHQGTNGKPRTPHSDPEMERLLRSYE